MELDSLQVEINPTCGIIGVISKSKTNEMIFEGLSILQNRGYDSAGIVTVDNEKEELVVSKYASRNSTDDAISLLEKDLGRHKLHSCGVGHTRWATHGAKTDVNAHPHLDEKGQVAVVHNGVIDNYGTLKKRLVEENGIKFQSETDTEVIAQLIGVHLNQKLAPLECVKQTISLIEGTWGLVIIFRKDPERLYCCRNGSPMLIGLSEKNKFVSSESSAFARYTREMIEMKNREIVVLGPNGVEEMIGENEQKEVSSRVVQIPKQIIELSPDPYPHWTIKEISEQPLSLHRALNYGGRIESDSQVKLGGLEQNKSWLMDINHLVITACGTSSYAGEFGAILFRKMKIFKSIRVVDASDLDIPDLPPGEDGGMLAISQSGETRDVIRSLEIGEECGVRIFSIVNRVGSMIARKTKCGVYINAGREIGVASTKAFTSQVTVLCLVGIWFAQHKREAHQIRRRLVSSLHRLPTTFGMIVRKVRDQCRVVAEYLNDHTSCFVLGRGFGVPIAKEGALKIKEITYLHAEAYSSGALKHGPFALLDTGVPVIVLVFDDKYFSLNMTCISEVKARDAHVIVITDCKERMKNADESMKNIDVVIPLPPNDILTYLNGVIPLQLIAYELSVIRKINPDKPRHLAKTVTVN